MPLLPSSHWKLVIDASNVFYSWILSSTKFVCQWRQTRKSDGSSADRAWIFNSASTDPVPLDTFQSQSRLIFPTPTLQHHLRTNESCNFRFYFLFIYSFSSFDIQTLMWFVYKPSLSIYLLFFQSLFLLSTWRIFHPVFIILILAFFRGVFLSVSCSKFSVRVQGVCLSVTYMAWEACRVFYPLQVTFCISEKSLSMLCIPSGCRLPRRWRLHASCLAFGHDNLTLSIFVNSYNVSVYITVFWYLLIYILRYLSLNFNFAFLFSLYLRCFLPYFFKNLLSSA